MDLRVSLTACACITLSAVPVYPAVFDVAPGDVAGLVAALESANDDIDHDRINISGTYVLKAIHNYTHGNNGLPSITSPVTIDGGAGAEIRRSSAPDTPAFRVFHVGETGTVTINAVTIAGGLLAASSFDWEAIGAGILSLGNLTVTNSAIVGNVAGDHGGGIAQIRAGTAFTLRNSIVAGNAASNGQNVGGLAVCCVVTIANSTISNNYGIGLSIAGVDEHGEFDDAVVSQLISSSVIRNRAVGPLGGVSAVGNVVISNSTIAENIGSSSGPAGIFLHSGVLSLVNVTVAANATLSSGSSATGGIGADPINNGRIDLVNTIVAANTRPGTQSDCGGAPIVSLGHNAIGSIEGCTVALLPSDIVGPVGLGPLTDDGTPGSGYLPPVAGSVAVDSGADHVCLGAAALSTDQIGNPRVGPCDIGAIELQAEAPAVSFAGASGRANCHGRSVSALAREFGGLSEAAAALGFPTVQALQKAIREFCEP